MTARTLVSVISIVLFTLSMGGCIPRVGPKTIRGDRFDYSGQISNSWKAQMMLNLVRIRYLDPPVFMDVAQVVTQYTLEGEATVSTPDWSTGVYYPGATALGRWSESPTITYNPMTGDKFTKSLLAPVSPISVLQLIQAGWPADVVFAIAVRNVNGLHSASNVQLVKRAPDPRYYRVIKLLRELQLTDDFSIRVEPPKEGEKEAPEGPFVEFGRREPDEESLAKAREVRKLLGLDQEENRFKVAFGAVQTNNKEIALLTRSILEIIGEASAGVEVPDSDLKEGRAVPVSLPGAPGETFRLTVRVRSSNSKPGPNEAFAAAQYHGHWFWIDDRDLMSKRALTFLLIISTLAEAGTSISPPVLTISKP